MTARVAIRHAVFPFDSGTSYVPTPVLTSFFPRGIIVSEIKKGTNQNGKIRQKKKVLYDSRL